MSVERELAALAARVRRLEEQLATGPQPGTADRPGGGSGSPEAVEEPFWALRGLQQRVGETGAVVWAGTVQTTDGPVEYQYGRAVAELDDLGPEELDRAAERLAALGSPVRLRILLAVLRGRTGTAALTDLPDVGTTGQVYHHVRALTAAGWLRSVGRGVVQVPPERVVAAWVAVSATQ